MLNFIVRRTGYRYPVRLAQMPPTGGLERLNQKIGHGQVMHPRQADGKLCG